MRKQRPIFAFFAAAILFSMVRAGSAPVACARPMLIYAGDDARLPRFDDYPAPEIWKGPAVKVKLRSSEERLFRTNLKNAAKEPPDLAGHYRFATWGCGTRCVSGAIIDLQSGNVFAPPLAGSRAGEEHWIFCTDFDHDRGAEYRTNSRLLILHCGHRHSDNENDAHYFLWEGDHFRELAQIPRTESNGVKAP